MHKKDYCSLRTDRNNPYLNGGSVAFMCSNMKPSICLVQHTFGSVVSDSSHRMRQPHRRNRRLTVDRTVDHIANSIDESSPQDVSRNA